MSKRPSVALLVETSNAYARGVLEGIMAYVRERQHWSIYLPEQRRGDTPPAWLAKWKGDGIIARIENDETARIITQTGLPVIDVSAARQLASVPWVETDDAVIAKLAAGHLLERGFNNLAYCGDARFNWSRWRCEGFCEELARHGKQCTIYPASETSLPWDEEVERLCDWLKGLPRPVGIFACYDIRAQQLLDACRELSIAVPEEIAVLGVDNDRLLCELCTPPLSSIIPDTFRTGYLAAELLDHRLQGKEVPAAGRFIPPLGIATRESTDILAIDDPMVARALRFIRENACTGINVADVVKAVNVSRRVIESRFEKAIGRSPHSEITRLKIQRAQELLRTTDLTLAKIAQRCGFAHVEYFSACFKQHMQESPRSYRQRPA
ncbi:MAG: XylR family transcriptional regulator [Pirellulales bacterium]